MGSIPGHWIWSLLTDHIVSEYSFNRPVLHNTGTVILARFAQKYDLPNSHPEFFVPTCRLMPVYGRVRPTLSAIYGDLGDAHRYTEWNEGTNWSDDDRYQILSVDMPSTRGRNVYHHRKVDH
jgi:hypothetical protein